MNLTVLVGVSLTTTLAATLGGGSNHGPAAPGPAQAVVPNVRYSVRELPVPEGFLYSGANDVNSHGEAAGAASGSNGTLATLYTGGDVAFLDDLGGLQHYANAINEAGQITGASQSQPWWGFKAVRWETDGTMTVIPPLTNDEHDNSYGLGINSVGQIVGQSDVHGGMWHAFLWDEHTGAIDLGTLGGSYSGANDLNDHGVVVGWSWSNVQTESPFIWNNGEMTALPTLDGSELPGGNARAINNRGIIVGEANGQQYGIRHAVRWDEEGEIHRLGSLGGLTSAAGDINDAGVIVGEGEIETGHKHAFIYRNAVMRDLNDFIPANSGWVLERALAISEDGRIVGTGRLNGTSRNFILEPVQTNHGRLEK